MKMQMVCLRCGFRSGAFERYDSDAYRDAWDKEMKPHLKEAHQIIGPRYNGVDLLEEAEK